MPSLNFPLGLMPPGPQLHRSLHTCRIGMARGGLTPKDRAALLRGRRAATCLSQSDSRKTLPGGNSNNRKDSLRKRVGTLLISSLQAGHRPTLVVLYLRSQFDNRTCHTRTQTTVLAFLRDGALHHKELTRVVLAKTNHSLNKETNNSIKCLKRPQNLL